MSTSTTPRPGQTSTLARLLRLASLLIPAAVAGFVTLRVHRDHLLHAMAPALVTVWVVMIGALVMRFVEARHPRHHAKVVDGVIVPIHRPSPWDHIDVLTASGAAMLWLGAASLLGGGLTGWASLSVLGVLGLGLVFLAVTWVVFVAGGDEPWRRAEITRSVLPELATEGDPLREELRLSGVRIPAGMRLFATGRATKHGPISRYAIGAEASGADLRLETALGEAPRGEHRAPPLTLWLGDILGLARTPAIQRGEATFLVLPKPATVAEVRRLLGRGGDDAARPAQHQPTEGSFRIREYVPGDDTRRIHWVRSAQRDQLIVRLPDEIPQAEPAVRLVLDNDMIDIAELTSRAPDDLLDAAVRVWLGVGRGLAERGTRVVLATALPAKDGDGLAWRVHERTMHARPSRDVLRLGARVAWQDKVPIGSMLARRPGVRHIVVSYRPRFLGTEHDVTWVVVPETAWTSAEPWLPTRMPMTLPFPMGSPENRLGRRAGERHRIQGLWRDRAEFSQLACWTDWSSYRGSYVARPEDGRVQLMVIP